MELTDRQSAQKNDEDGIAICLDLLESVRVGPILRTEVDDIPTHYPYVNEFFSPLQIFYTNTVNAGLNLHF